MVRSQTTALHFPSRVLCLSQMQQTRHSRHNSANNNTLDFGGIARVNTKVLTNGRTMASVFRHRRFRDILERGWDVAREGVPDLPGTLLHRHRRCLRPERVTPHRERSRQSFTNLMQEGGRVELHRVSPRLTALQAGCAFYVKEPMRF